MKESEFRHEDIKKVDIQPEAGYRNIRPEKEMSINETKDAVKAEMKKASIDAADHEMNDAGEKKGLSEEERKTIKEETNWSDDIIDNIDNMDQYEIYKNAGLRESEIDGRKCLIKEIDMDYVDPKTGMTNRQLMDNGRAPIDPKTGDKIELHHMGQKYDSPFAELCENSEHGDGNHSILHPDTVESWRNDSKLKNQYNNIDKPQHWKERAKEA